MPADFCSLKAKQVDFFKLKKKIVAKSEIKIIYRYFLLLLAELFDDLLRVCPA